ncbi:hydrolase [Bradyrhizobium sp. WBOS7]|uniref:Hydrolase n=2 Tax=Nitrobacteraceae TaxID=41294 RepID=A0AAE9SRE5_9BRAD|nr:hydrolase [Bradyrhizobium sp. WBOS2]MDD1569794.1 hydrolase [Bradyrhizobium sp. WBOS1]MDD1575893.1 hydrolase [Bradyrhizobium sp. WBOS7]MDD1599518.1 hydrolase [Bradyrhizobium sp. WBOS16]UUO35734.1 hydrolase [Bradyrhizobium sp. WBOS01]UUO42042.1 hydrolase [Bradyrhizobium sp. WBOS02]UUO56378.1 hydrolase [Bradyrhizobium sp. WBOS07]UUO66372.1 hydrolase [Bradyrhizobium betae]
MKRDQSLEVIIPPLGLAGMLTLPDNPRGLVAFAHGSGSSRFSVRNIAVAQELNARRFATLLFDLLTPQEEHDRANVFNVGMLGKRLVAAVDWLQGLKPAVACLPIGLFGASTGAAAALIAAAQLPDRIAAVVSRGGRPDLAGEALPHVRAPTLLIVGGADVGVIELNEEARSWLGGLTALEIIPGATHLFPEPGAMDAVIEHASRWFERYLQAPTSVRAAS